MVEITLYRNGVPDVKEFETLDAGMHSAFAAMSLGSGFLTKVMVDGEVLWEYDDSESDEDAIIDLQRFLEDFDDIRQEVENEE